VYTLHPALLRSLIDGGTNTVRKTVDARTAKTWTRRTAIAPDIKRPDTLTASAATSFDRAETLGPGLQSRHPRERALSG
jgi:hypothetical protein